MTWRELNHRLGKTKDRKLVLKFYEAERKLDKALFSNVRVRGSTNSSLSIVDSL